MTNHLQVYSIVSAVFMAHLRKVQSEDAIRRNDTETALLAAESRHYWLKIQADRLAVLQGSIYQCAN